MLQTDTTNAFHLLHVRSLKSRGFMLSIFIITLDALFIIVDTAFESEFSQKINKLMLSFFCQVLILWYNLLISLDLITK